MCCYGGVVVCVEFRYGNIIEICYVGFVVGSDWLWWIEGCELWIVVVVIFVLYVVGVVVGVSDCLIFGVVGFDDVWGFIVVKGYDVVVWIIYGNFLCEIVVVYLFDVV